MISKRSLGTLTYIAKGGVGSVYRLPGFSLPGHPPLAYKEVHDSSPGPLKPAARQQALDAMAKSVAFRASLSQADRDDLDRYTTWPIDMVEDNGAPCGLVMPLIPPDFFIRTTPLTGAPEDLVFSLSWLCAKTSQAQSAGVDRSGVSDLLVRIALLAQLVYAVGRLHAHGVVYGDLSLKNAALAVNPPRIKLLDCDAAAALADASRVQLHSLTFTPPENLKGTQKLQDDRTDIYKLGLCIIRGLQQGQGVTQATDPAALAGKLDAHAIRVIARAVGDDRAQRPYAQELFDALVQNLLSKAAPPTVRSAWLSRAALLRGQDVEVIWDAVGGKEVRITGPNGLEIVLPDPGTVPARYVITPPASGRITVEVGNRHGNVLAVAGDVQLYELPAFHLDMTGIPRPALPSVPAVAIPPVLHALPPVPMVSTAQHPAPRVELPPMTPVADALAATRAAHRPFDRLVGAAAPTNVVLQAATRFSSAGAAHPDLGGLAADAAAGVREVFDDARHQLRQHVAKEVQAALSRKAPGP